MNKNLYEQSAFKKYEPRLKKNSGGLNLDSWELYDNIKNKSNNNKATLAMRHITTKGADSDEVYDEISKVFFSSENMNRIQKMIKKMIYEKTTGKYRLDDDQDESDLLVAMRAVFFEHSRFLPIKIIHQVKELNKRTVEYIIPDMITEMKQAYGYIKEINEPIKPIPRPLNVNNAGRRTLPSLTSRWGF